jgi:valyl-tRNA synthetase
LQEADLLKAAITAIRDARLKAQIKNKDAVSLYATVTEKATWHAIQEILCKQINAVAFNFTDDAVADTIQLVLEADRLYIKTDQILDTSVQRKSLEDELTYYKGFLASVEKKLSNEKFVANAKGEVVDMERKKQADAIAKISLLEESLRNL